jgi:hypothetical protein
MVDFSHLECALEETVRPQSLQHCHSYQICEEQLSPLTGSHCDEHHRSKATTPVSHELKPPNCEPKEKSLS